MTTTTYSDPYRVATQKTQRNMTLVAALVAVAAVTATTLVHFGGGSAQNAPSIPQISLTHQVEGEPAIMSGRPF